MFQGIPNHEENFIPFGLLTCALAAVPAHAAPATGTITNNVMTMDANQYLTITVEYSAQNNTPGQGQLEVRDACYVIDGAGPGRNYYLLDPNHPATVPIDSSQFPGGSNMGPWITKWDRISASRSYAYNNDVALVFTKAGYTPVQLDYNSRGPQTFPVGP